MLLFNICPWNATVQNTEMHTGLAYWDTRTACLIDITALTLLAEDLHLTRGLVHDGLMENVFIVNCTIGRGSSPGNKSLRSSPAETARMFFFLPDFWYKMCEWQVGLVATPT